MGPSLTDGAAGSGAHSGGAADGGRPERARTSRGRVRNLYVRLLGVVFVIAFASLHEQALVLWGEDGLLPAAPYVAAWEDAIERGERLAVECPTVFRLDASDAALLWAARAGMAAGLLLVLLVLPGPALLAAELLYLSFVTVDRRFLFFQWDNLLLEAGFFTLFVVPWRLAGWRAPAPHPIGTALLLWLVFRLHVESGLAKLLGGDPTWRDLSAMESYYETAPLPTWVGWWVHQLPAGWHRGCAAFTYFAECVVPLLMLWPRWMRPVAFAVLTALHLSIALTANYGFFNYLSWVLCLLVLDDGHLRRAAASVRWRLPEARSRAALPRWRRRGAHLALGLAAAVLVPLSIVPFLPWVARAAVVSESPAFRGAVREAQRVAGTWPEPLPLARLVQVTRCVNAYHLFASMTLVRDEVVIEGTLDGQTWQPYELHHKPGDVGRAPAFVAPHQPRVDFQLWFLLLGRDDTLLPFPVWLGQQVSDPGAAYFRALLARLLTTPGSVAPLLAHDPFDGAAPRQVRLAVYRYAFTDRETRRRTGAWWRRELVGRSMPIGAADVRGR